MTSTEKVAIPLTIGAAVIGIWAALRKPQAQSVTISGTGLGQTSGGSVASLPSVQPTPLVTIAPEPFGGAGQFGSSGTGYDNTGGDGIGIGGPGNSGAGGAGGGLGSTPAGPNAAWVNAANGNPWEYYDFGPPFGTPVYSPQGFSMLGVIPSPGTTPGGVPNQPSPPWIGGITNPSMFGGSGKGCGCGCGGHGGKTNCGAPRANNMLTEGSGACVPSIFGSASAGNEIPVIGYSVMPPPILTQNPFAGFEPLQLGSMN